MPEHRALPDIVLLVLEHLRGDAAVTGVAAADHIDIELPASFPDGNRVLVSRVGGSPVDAVTERVDRPLVQVEAYGATIGDAWDVAAAVLVSLQSMPSAAFAGAVVTGVDRLSGPRWLPEPVTTTPRYVTDIAVYVHAA